MSNRNLTLGPPEVPIVLCIPLNSVFVAVIEVSRPEEAVRIAERLTEAARRTGRTISVGVALPQPGEPAERTLRRADQALYQVKRQGRDAVRLAAA